MSTLLTELGDIVAAEDGSSLLLEGDVTGMPMSIRDQVLATMRLPALVGGEIGIVSSQYADVVAGRDVVLTRDQVDGFVGPGDKPDNLDDHDTWTLRGDDALIPGG